MFTQQLLKILNEQKQSLLHKPHNFIGTDFIKKDKLEYDTIISSHSSSLSTNDSLTTTESLSNKSNRNISALTVALVGNAPINLCFDKLPVQDLAPQDILKQLNIGSIMQVCSYGKTPSTNPAQSVSFSFSLCDSDTLFKSVESVENSFSEAQRHATCVRGL